LLEQLVHNGIIVPAAPEPLGLSLRVRGQIITLTPLQEEMALAWSRKRDTPYVQDPVFCANFMHDFALALGVQPDLQVDDVDWTPCDEVVDAERARREALTPEERKAAAAERKAERLALKRKYGYAIVDGQRVELGNYMTEPSGIFMGRGEHPLRGRWKSGARQSDVTLNLSPDAPPLPGDWEIVWQPESLWVARWHDELSDKLKYVWLSDTAPVKQSREEAKFDKAVTLSAHLRKVRARIEKDLASDEQRLRMVATACYLIDALCLRVGDEKDPDEADTVGATTLRPEHITLQTDGQVEFRFLGKDSVAWHKTLRPPVQVLTNLAELSRDARPSGTRGVHGDKPQLFPNIGSHDVNAYLSSIIPGLSAKVFRTHHATSEVHKSLEGSGVRAEHADYKKWHAASLANWKAAQLCNHTKQDKSDWNRTRERYKQRAEKAQARIVAAAAKVEQAEEKLESLQAQAVTAETEAASEAQRGKVKERYRLRVARAREDIQRRKAMKARASDALHKIRAQEDMAGKKRTWNLGTSLKSYIDPRVYYRWGNEVDYDVLSSYYPTQLRRKFAWVRGAGGESDPEASALLERLDVRPCRVSDAPRVMALFRAIESSAPDLQLPVDTDELTEHYLPWLEREWRQGIVVLDETEAVVAFVSVGPELGDCKDRTLDLHAAFRQGWDTPAMGSVLADAVWQAVQAYEAQHPGKEPSLLPVDGGWQAVSSHLGRALELEGADGDDSDGDNNDDEDEA